VTVDTPAVRAAVLPSARCAALRAASSYIRGRGPVLGGQAVPVLAGCVKVPGSILPTHANFAPWGHDAPCFEHPDGSSIGRVRLFQNVGGLGLCGERLDVFRKQQTLFL
jgi:hypothetical protein